jgi:glycosyltransferase involved in cell wall biosynthesis
MNFSILACTYNNPYYLKNFLWTVNNQDYDGPYETIIVDNASPEPLVNVCAHMMSYKINLQYYRIQPEDKKCTNISQGINLAASKAKGRFFVIVADPNVLLSHNLLSSISKAIKYDNVVLSAGPDNDVKISPDGRQQTEYRRLPTEIMQEKCAALLKEMGWYCDPIELKLLPGKHRWPPPHLRYDCYIVALSRMNFFKFGGYPTHETSWGRYHDIYTEKLSKNLKEVRLKGIRIVHQYHPVFKEAKN